MCHMVADTPSELHDMAARIGVARRWFQTAPPASIAHYDVCQSKRLLAIEFGAQVLDRRGFVMKVRELRAKGCGRDG